MRQLRERRVGQVELPEPQASQPQVVVQSQAALQEAARREFPRKLAVQPGLPVSPLAALPQAAEARQARVDAPVARPQLLSSA